MADVISFPARRGNNERREVRWRVLRGAVLRFNRGYGAFEAVVRDESRNGAQLRIGDTTGVPAVFELEITGNPSRRTAMVRWRSKTAIGVEFVPSDRAD